MVSSIHLLVIVFIATVNAFTPTVYTNHDLSQIRRSTKSTTTTTCYGVKVSAETLASIGYTVKVNKPLGVVFGENRAPYFGLVVDDVEPGLNGGKAGLKIGDQLLSVDGIPVVGNDFDSAINLIRNAVDPFELDLYRGPVTSLYTIMMNLEGTSEMMTTDEDDELDDDSIILDENYESPVQIDLSQWDEPEQTLEESASNVVKNLSKMFRGNDDNDNDDDNKAGGNTKKKGIFDNMFNKETFFDDGK